jgi:hypothetical protein
MAKKMYDILPPKEAKKLAHAIKALGEEDKKERKEKSIPHKKPALATRKKKERRFPLRELIIGGIIILLIIGAYLYVSLAKAEINVYPKLDAFNFSEKVVSDKSVNVVDMAKKIIPAQYVEQENDNWQDFPATGSASNQGNATGTITVYNKVSPSTPVSLKAGTHFLSDSGKYFVTTQKIVVPGIQGKNPGSVAVSVQAEDSGTDYNIGPSNFSVPKLSGTAYYYGVWAESTTAMSGGYTGQVKKVTQEDLSKAKDTLTQKLLDVAEATLRSKLSADDVILDSAVTRTVVSATSAVKQDTVVDTFTEQAKVNVSALVFKKQDLQQLITSDITSQLSDGENFLNKSLQINYTVDSVDTQNGKINLTVQSSANEYYPVDINDLLYNFRNKTADEMKSYVDQKYASKVSQLQVHFWPFWVSRAPQDNKKITVNVIFP